MIAKIQNKYYYIHRELRIILPNNIEIILNFSAPERIQT